MTAPTLQTGLIGRADKTVQAQDLADQVGSGDLPVLATPIMAALMEEAAVSCVREALDSNTTSVGINLDISHLAATPKGKRVQAQAELAEVKGKKLIFAVKAWDEAELIGQGTHERVIVNRQAFLDRAEGK